MSILFEIFAQKRLEVAHNQAHKPLEQIQAAAQACPPAKDFAGSLNHRTLPDFPALIAEVKHRSPSRGILRENFDPVQIAMQYIKNGASAISVLTDEQYFGGSLEAMRLVAEIPGRPPLLRKDFIFHPYQIFEARLYGADAVLLIAAMLSAAQLSELYDTANELGMAALVEVHTAAELTSALDVKPTLLGINNRDLNTFDVRLETTFELRQMIPAGICLVSESGIHTCRDVQNLAAAGVDAVLVGEALITSPDLPAKVRELSGFHSTPQVQP